MGITKPFHRTYRSQIDPHNGYSDWAYIVEKGYAQSPAHYIRAYTIIQNDLEKLFEYIEPSDEANSTFSYRIHELLMRTCIEIEANFKAILNENVYSGSNYNIIAYKKIDITHHLSSYEVILPIWNGAPKVFTPFLEWKTNSPLTWYRAYNASKHDRQDEFKQANFENLLNAVAGLLVLLSAQFRTEDFSSGATLLATEDGDEEWGPAIGSLFRIKFPTDWTDADKYDFNWSTLKGEADRFQKFNYNSI